MRPSLRIALAVFTIAAASSQALAEDYPNTLAGCLLMADDQLGDCIDWNFPESACNQAHTIVQQMCHQQYEV